ncbi:hypothetical protein HPB47_000418 [Ixodes persulcatus]|uniref:Uncharacterized protein n=1 Tax=Ixodes persulcatus TaxID=34615 RepID=A0AC60PSI1_IXOPE|nr:hypothetical protein HPB47_000418 [Ixodes persulcatus]
MPNGIRRSRARARPPGLAPSGSLRRSSAPGACPAFARATSAESVVVDSGAARDRRRKRRISGLPCAEREPLASQLTFAHAGTLRDAWTDCGDV